MSDLTPRERFVSRGGYDMDMPKELFLADKEIERLQAENAALRADVAEHEKNEKEEAEVMQRCGVQYCNYFWDGWIGVVDERDELRAELAALKDAPQGETK